jgi:alkanesulfonate monooxygenase SsuD/methylene tetrahydromethanopterin reductase-like flavin-dependent oxidoreductase (luciferase family)
MVDLHFGIVIPNFGNCCGSAIELSDLAFIAENSGWDGFFVFDHIHYTEDGRVPMVDPWVALAAIAMNTKRIRLGTLVTPIARRRPWKLARETISIDHLSAGRLILGVGLGDPIGEDFTCFGEDTNDRIRAEKLDEGLDILSGLWSGEQFSYEGKHYRIQNAQFLPSSLQQPRIPIWVAGRWPRREPFLRAARWDGVFPLGINRGSKLSPEDIRQVTTFIKDHRKSNSPYDVIATSGADGQIPSTEKLSEYETAGVTWWIEDVRGCRDSRDELQRCIENGPPRT